MHPRIVAALRAQLEARDAGARRVGWKVALGIAEVEALIGREPVIGTLTGATQLEDGATHRGPGPLHADAEVVIEAGTGVSASAWSWSTSRGRRAGWRRSSPPTSCTARSCSDRRGPAPVRGRRR